MLNGRRLAGLRAILCEVRPFAAGLQEAIDLAERLGHNPCMRIGAQIRLGLILGCTLLSGARANPILPPGDMQLRSDLQLLNDTGVSNPRIIRTFENTPRDEGEEFRPDGTYVGVALGNWWVVQVAQA